MAHQSFGKVCVLSQSEVECLEKDGIVPDCRDHRHVGRRAAESLVSTHKYRERRAARSVVPLHGSHARPAITFEFAPKWRPRAASDLALRALPGGPRLKNLQLVP
jgi:hypothetical protein